MLAEKIFTILTRNGQELTPYQYNGERKRWEYLSSKLKKWKGDHKFNRFVRWFKKAFIPAIIEFLTDDVLIENKFLNEVFKGFFDKKNRLTIIGNILKALLPLCTTILTIAI